MADDRLRELERRFRESGSVEDEAAWIQARLRSGVLGMLQVHLAAWLFHPASCMTLRSPLQVLRTNDKEYQWGENLLALIDAVDENAHAQFCVRILAASFLVQHRDFEQDHECRVVMSLVLNWLMLPAEEGSIKAREAHRSGFDINPEYGIWDAHNPQEEPPEQVVQVTRLARAHQILYQAAIAFEGRRNRVNHLKHALSNMCEGGNEWLYENAKQVGTYLVPWILNSGTDPLLEELSRQLNQPGP